MSVAGLAVSSGGRFIPGFFHAFFRLEETISSSFFRKKMEETKFFFKFNIILLKFADK